jgi:polyisoprenoid-binding protein YceI
MSTASPTLAALTAGVWNVDPSHSTIGFSARHLVIAKVRGRFTDFTGSITVGANPLESSVQAVAQVASISTNDEQRDGHLKSGDFLDAETYPTLAFTSTSIREDDGDYVLVGDLTIKGVTKSVEFALEFEGVGNDPWGGTRAGFSAETEINRKDFGVEFNVVLETGGALVSDKVKITLDIEAVRA